MDKQPDADVVASASKWLRIRTSPRGRVMMLASTTSSQQVRNLAIRRLAHIGEQGS
jgi:hypothetical protein